MYDSILQCAQGKASKGHRRTFGTTTPPKSFFYFARPSSNSQSGTTTPLTAPRCKTCDTPMPDTAAPCPKRPRTGRKASTVSSQSLAGTAGRNGKTTSQTVKEAMTRYFPLKSLQLSMLKPVSQPPQSAFSPA